MRGAAVLVRTDFSQHWRTERYARDNPYLTGEACDRWCAGEPRSWASTRSTSTTSATWPAPPHTILLGAGIPICEHLTNLAALPPDGGHLHAVPIPWRGGATFPVRAYVQL